MISNAQEFVACQDENDPGVLILSPFAGAGGLMQEALQVNPYEVENVADTLHRALEMPLDQRQMRMFQLKKREKRMDVGAWVQGFLGAMGAIYTDQEDKQPRTEEAISKIGQGDFDRNLGPLVDHCSRLGVILDFDGTLSPLARKPELAIIPSETKRVLERLSAYSDCKITVISGRSIEDLQRKVVEYCHWACKQFHPLHRWESIGSRMPETMVWKSFIQTEPGLKAQLLLVARRKPLDVL